MKHANLILAMFVIFTLLTIFTKSVFCGVIAGMLLVGWLAKLLEVWLKK